MQVSIDNDLTAQIMGMPDLRGQVHEPARPRGIEGHRAACGDRSNRSERSDRDELVQRNLQGRNHIGVASGWTGTVRFSSSTEGTAAVRSFSSTSRTVCRSVPETSNASANISSQKGRS